MFAPESGNMLGGTIVNITGPCFKPDDRITCRFDTESVIGAVVDSNRAICVQPRFWHNGYARFEIAINNEPYKWKGKYFVGKSFLNFSISINYGIIKTDNFNYIIFFVYIFLSVFIFALYLS